MTNTVLLLLEKDLAVDVLHEVAKPDRSEHLVARAIVDNDFGDASLITTRPQDEHEEHLLRLRKMTPGKAFAATRVLRRTPGVISATLF
ncbi:MAG: hypothetical protein KGI97_00060 [Alphaproteobacteria bacterium]|nr:hypothetical protein [Alphaproteobacteria bacterium]